MNPRVSIVIVNWNGKEYLKECLSSLLAITYKNYKVILVDNGSTDGSVELVQKTYPNIEIIQVKKNLGYAQANTIGYQAGDGKYILFLNNDTVVPKNFLESLVNVLQKDDKLAAVQPKVIFYRPGHIWHKKINSVGSFLTKYGFLYHRGFGKDPDLEIYNKPTSILSAHGSCMLVRKSVIDEVGCFDASYFAYFEETDLCMRIWMAGYKIYYEPTSWIYHTGAKTSSKLDESFVQFHSYKNRLYTLLKNLSLGYLLLIIPQYLLYCEIASIAFIFIGKPRISLAIQKSIFWNIIHSVRLLRERSSIQKKIRKVQDKEFLPKLIKNFKVSYFYYMSTGKLEQYNE